MGKSVNCSVCGVWIELPEGTQYRKYCDACRKAVELARAQAQQQKVRAERAAAKAAYLPEAYTAKKKSSESPAKRVLDERGAAARRESIAACGDAKDARRAATKGWDMRGKSAAQVCVEARALGLSYGQYCAAVSAGTIERTLRDLGIDDGLARVRKAWREHQRQKEANARRKPKAADPVEAGRNQQAWGRGDFAPPPK